MIARPSIEIIRPRNLASRIGSGLVEVIEPGQGGALGATFGEAICAALACSGVAAISPEVGGARYGAAGSDPAPAPAAAAALIRRELRRRCAALVIIPAAGWHRCAVIEAAANDAIAKNRPVFLVDVPRPMGRKNLSNQGAGSWR
jgi:hypothetical protein